MYKRHVLLLPKSDVGVNLEAYNKVFHDPTIMQSLWVTVLVTVVFTAIGMFLTVCASYAPVSYPHLISCGVLIATVSAVTARAVSSAATGISKVELPSVLVGRYFSPSTSM